MKIRKEILLKQMERLINNHVKKGGNPKIFYVSEKTHEEIIKPYYRDNFSHYRAPYHYFYFNGIPILKRNDMEDDIIILVDELIPLRG